MLPEVATVVEAVAGVTHDRGVRIGYGHGSSLPLPLVLRVQALHLLEVVLQDAFLAKVRERGQARFPRLPHRLPRDKLVLVLDVPRQLALQDSAQRAVAFAFRWVPCE